MKQSTRLLCGISPESVLYYFEEISRIPRGSGNEAAVAEYLVAFAKERALYCHRDAANNVLIRKAATPDRTAAPALLLQGHTDMVCEKNGATTHDFLTDPIHLVKDGEWLRAEGTTLGGDDGIAVAMMLALLDGALASHPTYECLFTTEEETGMGGAIAFDYSLLTARHMINLDSEEEDQITVGCAGGLRTDLTLPVQRIADESGETCRISLTGLCGGHSGENINCGRANANNLMARMLCALQKDHELRLISIDGGSKDNAIPRECEAIVRTRSAAALAMALMLLSDEIGGELVEEDSGCTVRCERLDTAACAALLPPMDTASTHRVLAALNTIPCGVLRMSMQVPGLVEYSRNVGVLKTEETAVCLTASSRSCRESLLDHTEQSLADFALLCGGTAQHRSRYPGWEYAPDSAVRSAYLAAYAALYGKTPRTAAIHAGLECGYIRKQIPNMDIISIGPDMQGIHSPDERLHLPSVDRVWRALCRVIDTWN